jgi:hypothetical protein
MGNMMMMMSKSQLYSHMSRLQMHRAQAETTHAITITTCADGSQAAQPLSTLAHAAWHIMTCCIAGAQLVA